MPCALGAHIPPAACCLAALTPAPAPPLSISSKPQADTRSESAADPIAQALACPCIDDLKASACGGALVAAFTCFHRSTTVPKGCDCLPLHQAFAVRA